MTPARSAFDRELDALLSRAAEPVAAPDLARRIVVRTAHLPQKPAIDPDCPVHQSQPPATQPPAIQPPATQPLAKQPRTTRSQAIARRGQGARFAGGAIAACLLAIIVAGQQATPGAPQATGSEATASRVVASLDRGELPKAEPVPSRPEEASQPVQLASREQSLSGEPTGTAPSPAPDEKPAVEDQSKPVQLAQAGERSPLGSSGIEGFKLAGNDEGEAQVYGPVLEPEQHHLFASRSAGEGAALGVAGGARALSSNHPGW